MAKDDKNLPEKAKKPALPAETSLPIGRVLAAGEIACTTVVDISETIQDASKSLKAIADHIDLDRQDHKEDCFASERSDDILPALQMIPRSVEKIKTVFSTDVVATEGKNKISP